jgi:hypothetical protein
MNALFGTIRELCHGAPSGESTDALVEVCEEVYEVDPEYACEVVLPYVLPELAGWSDEVVFGEDTRSIADIPGEGNHIWDPIGVKKHSFEWLIEDAFLHGSLLLGHEVFDYMYRLLTRVAPAYPRGDADPPMQRLDFHGDTFCDRRWPLFGVERFREGHVCPPSNRDSTHPLRLVASMHMVRDDACGVFDKRLEYIETRHVSAPWCEVVDDFGQEHLGPLQPHDGLWPGEIAFLETRLGYTFDPRLYEYLRLFGRLDKLPNSNEYPSNPYSWVHCSGPTPIVPILLEPHGNAWFVIRLDQPGAPLRIHETWESNRLDRQPGRTETLQGFALPFGQKTAADAGLFCKMMSGGYVQYWNRFDGLAPSGLGSDDEDVPF